MAVASYVSYKHGFLLFRTDHTTCAMHVPVLQPAPSTLRLLHFAKKSSPLCSSVPLAVRFSPSSIRKN
ncbi:hypothetical protein Csa_015738 [Cucumis sativus]|uniref:Uncharacterized protein n=1 Tax=Cucumis sativus TaxID=3659 RepID=A0A0A0K9S7_CUCSA|nr:hypothetical protein Csa_015738 [Cucumis sativus]